MVFYGNPCKNGWFGGTTIYGNPHIHILSSALLVVSFLLLHFLGCPADPCASYGAKWGSTFKWRSCEPSWENTPNIGWPNLAWIILVGESWGHTESIQMLITIHTCESENKDGSMPWYPEHPDSPFVEINPWLKSPCGRCAQMQIDRIVPYCTPFFVVFSTL